MGRHKLSDERLLVMEAPLNLSTCMHLTDFTIYKYIRCCFYFPLSLSKHTVIGSDFYEQAQAYCGPPAYATVSPRLTPIPFDILIYEQVASWSPQQIACEFVLKLSGVRVGWIVNEN